MNKKLEKEWELKILSLVFSGFVYFTIWLLKGLPKLSYLEQTVGTILFFLCYFVLKDFFMMFLRYDKIPKD